MFDDLRGASRLLLVQELKPAQGDRFQPTGFADLGAAVYDAPGGKRMLLVESAQSVANRLEATCLDNGGPEIEPELVGLPYVRASLVGPVETVTTSLVEAHRLNSPFIIANKMIQEAFIERSGYAKGQPIDWSRIAKAVFYYDPNSLLHGVFMANVEDGRVRFSRVVSGFIEAQGVREAASGGVKNNPLDPTGKLRASGYDKDVYSNVPYGRMEYTADCIRAYFNLDVALIRGYRLDDDATNLLIALGLYKVRRFLNSGLRLRTACDFVTSGDLVCTMPEGRMIPAEPELLGEVQRLIRQCGQKGLFADPPITVLTTECAWKKEDAPAAAR